MFHRRRISIPSSISFSNTITKMSSPSSLSSNRFTLLFITLFLSLTLFFLFYPKHPCFHTPTLTRHISRSSNPPFTRRHILFSIASSAASFTRRGHYLRLWYSPKSTRAFAFLDRRPPVVDPSLPPVIVSGDTSRFPYKFKRGLRSAIRVARVVKEAVELNETDVRWFVFGDDDTVFFVENLVRVLGKYDHERWFYVGSVSESYEQNEMLSFDMAFGGGGFAISYALGRALARVLDSCLMRYAHLYGSDSRIFSCLAELGVGLTHEPGFHQVDIRGNLFGLLSAHPLSPLVSLHHLDAADPIFPDMDRTQAMELLFKAVNVDSTRILQQTVCYDHLNTFTVSVSWGYAVQVFEGNELLPDLLSLQKTFSPWRRGSHVTSHYMFNTREYPRDPCKRALVFFLESVTSDNEGITTKYTRKSDRNCLRADSLKNLRQIVVFSRKLELDTEEMKAPRRQCCDIAPSYNDTMSIHIRGCGTDELISMHI